RAPFQSKYRVLTGVNLRALKVFPECSRRDRNAFRLKSSPYAPADNKCQQGRKKGANQNILCKWTIVFEVIKAGYPFGGENKSNSTVLAEQHKDENKDPLQQPNQPSHAVFFITHLILLAPNRSNTHHFQNIAEYDIHLIDH